MKNSLSVEEELKETIERFNGVLTDTVQQINDIENTNDDKALDKLIDLAVIQKKVINRLVKLLSNQNSLIVTQENIIHTQEKVIETNDKKLAIQEAIIKML